MFIDKYKDKQLNDSFDYIERFIKSKVKNWEVAPNTSVI